jgi:hypothetical protein
MVTNRVRAGRAGRPVDGRGGEYRWPGYLQALVVVLLTVMFAWVAASMVAHRFGRGALSHQMYKNRE